MDRVLLIVDDEENIRRSLQRLLRQDGYQIHSAGSAREGLEILTNIPVGVVVSDQRMPEMSGIEFLSQVKELYPDTIRLVLSGYTDLKTVTEAINQGAIYKFLTKPWEDELLRKNIQQAFHQYELVDENKRLNAESVTLNEELVEANKVLETQAQRRIRYSDINLLTLQLTQQVLENLPMAVLGVGLDGEIVVANLKAHNLLFPGSGGIVGLNVTTVMPNIRPALWENPLECVQEMNIGDQLYELRASSLAKQTEPGIKAIVIVPKLA